MGRPGQATVQGGFCGRPLGGDDREHRGVAEETVLPRRVRLRPVAKNALELRPQALDSAPGLLVARAGLEVDPAHAQGLERILKQQELCPDIDARSLSRSGQPGPADLNGTQLGIHLRAARPEPGSQYTVTPTARPSLWRIWANGASLPPLARSKWAARYSFTSHARGTWVNPYALRSSSTETARSSPWLIESGSSRTREP